MFQNFFKTSIRSLLRHKGYTIINILGLTSGVAAFLIICLYIQWERSYDEMVTDRQNTYRLVQIQQAEGVGEQHVAITSYALAPELKRSIPGCIDVCRFMPGWNEVVMVDDTQHKIDRTACVDPSFFSMMGGEILYGETENLLQNAEDVLLCEKLATVFFGAPENAIGKMIERGGESYIIRSVFKDLPRNFHLKTDIMFSYHKAIELYPWMDSFGNNSQSTYMRMKPGSDPHAFEEIYLKMARVLLDEMGAEDFADEDIPRVYLQSVNDIHLRSLHLKFQINEDAGSYKIVFVFMLIAAFIILIACINFINITIAQSVKKAREVGVRKTLGASRKSLISQFFGEAFFLALISVILAVAVVELFLPGFNRIMNLELTVDLFHNPIFNIYLILLIIGISLIAGLYPALYLSKFDPVQTLKGTSSQIAGSGNILQKVLVITQFTVSVVLILCVMIIRSQTTYVLNKDLGMNIDDVVSIPLKNHKSRDDVKLLKNRLLSNPDILAVGGASAINGVSGSQSSIHVNDSAETEVQTRMGYQGFGFMEVLEVPLIEGRYFDETIATDESRGLIINRAMMEYLQWDDPIGKEFQPMYNDTMPRRVIGVIEDYHYYSLLWKIEPAAYYIDYSDVHILGVRVRPGTLESSIAFIEQQWEELFPEASFEFELASEAARGQYHGLKRANQIFGWFSLLSIVISILGLWGVSSLNIDRRVKEIGVRKVLGGSLKQIMFLLQKDFLKLVLIAGVIAVPFGYFLSQNLLSQFAYRIKISIWYFLGAILLAFVVASVTIGIKAFRAARSNPVKALKYE